VVKKILAVYKGDARDWERVGEWVERIGWPAFFEKTRYTSSHQLPMLACR
jgi:sulfite reductase beta subunit